MGRFSAGVDLVGIDIFVESFGDGLIKPSEQLGEGFAIAAAEHGQGVVAVIGHGDTADRIHFANGDFSLGDQIRDVRQGQNDRPVRRLQSLLRGGLVCWGQVCGDVPWQQFLDAIDWMFGDAAEHMAQVRFGVEAVHLCRPD